jgi:hypothetical protein
MATFQQPVPGMKSDKAHVVDVKKFYSGIVNVYQLVPKAGGGDIEAPEIMRPEKPSHSEKAIKKRADALPYIEYERGKNSYNNKPWLIGITKINGQRVRKSPQINVTSVDYDQILHQNKSKLNPDLMHGEADLILWSDEPWKSLQKPLEKSHNNRTKLFELAMELHITQQRMEDVANSYLRNVLMSQEKAAPISAVKTKKKTLGMGETQGTQTQPVPQAKNIFDATPEEDKIQLRKRKQILVNLKRQIQGIRKPQKLCICKPKRVIKSHKKKVK